MSEDIGVQVGIERGYHLARAGEMAGSLRAWIDGRPQADWNSAQVGCTYLIRHSGESRQEVWRIVSMTPSRAFMEAWDERRGCGTRLCRGNYHYTKWAEIDAGLIALQGITHRAIVETAAGAGMEIPARVRREYPTLFVQIPERFRKGDRERDSEIERVRRSLADNWFGARGMATPPRVLEWIEEARAEIRRRTCERTRAAVAYSGNDQAAVAEPIALVINENLADIEFYQWLLPHVSEGGVFYLGEEAGNDTA